jgi:hypothetical protein
VPARRQRPRKRFADSRRRAGDESCVH